MAKLQGKKRRDKYGRYKGTGGIKPFKSNLPAGRKGWSKKKKVAVAVGVAAGAVALNRVGQRQARNQRHQAIIDSHERRSSQPNRPAKKTPGQKAAAKRIKRSTRAATRAVARRERNAGVPRRLRGNIYRSITING